MKIKIISLLIAINFLFISFPMGTEANSGLRSPGIAPGDFFYFLDKFQENFVEFFTFNKKAKVKLKLKYAEERLAEINSLAEEDQDEKLIFKTQEDLRGEITELSKVVQKEDDEDRRILSKAILENFFQLKAEAKGVFEKEKATFFAKKSDLKEKLKLAIENGDEAEKQRIEEELREIEIKKDKAEVIKNNTIAVLETDKESLLSDLDDEDLKEIKNKEKDLDEDSECQMDNDCEEGEVCMEGDCEDTDREDFSCSVDSDCEDDEICYQGDCEIIECKTDSECEYGEICHEYECEDREDLEENEEDEEELDCTVNSDCDNGEVCYEGECEIVECYRDSDCDKDEFCDKYECEDIEEDEDEEEEDVECRIDSDCGDNDEICIDYECENKNELDE